MSGGGGGVGELDCMQITENMDLLPRFQNISSETYK